MKIILKLKIQTFHIQLVLTNYTFMKHHPHTYIAFHAVPSIHMSSVLRRNCVQSINPVIFGGFVLNLPWTNDESITKPSKAKYCEYLMGYTVLRRSTKCLNIFTHDWYTFYDSSSHVEYLTFIIIKCILHPIMFILCHNDKFSPLKQHGIYMLLEL